MTKSEVGSDQDTILRYDPILNGDDGSKRNTGGKIPEGSN